MKTDTILQGDCLELLRKLPRASVDCVVTDPPYFLPATHYNVRSRASRSLSDLSIIEHFYGDVFKAIARILKPDAFMYVFCDGQSYPVFYAQAYHHFRALRPLIWDKMVSFNGFGWRHQHELILFCEGHEAPRVKTGDGDIIRCRAVPIEEREHLAQKPVELLSKLIAKTTPECGLVLDPFAGSASTLIAAREVGRHYIGIERDEQYVAIAQARLEAAPPLRLVKPAPKKRAKKPMQPTLLEVSA